MDDQTYLAMLYHARFTHEQNDTSLLIRLTTGCLNNLRILRNHDTVNFIRNNSADLPSRQIGHRAQPLKETELNANNKLFNITLVLFCHLRLGRPNDIFLLKFSN